MKRVSRKKWKVLCDNRKRERTKIMTEEGRKKEDEEEGMEVKRKLPGHENLTPGKEERRNGRTKGSEGNTMGEGARKEQGRMERRNEGSEGEPEERKGLVRDRWRRKRKRESNAEDGGEGKEEGRWKREKLS